MRTLVVGDIHGCYGELLQLMEKVRLTNEDCLISLGDIVDRGADSVRVYDLLRARPNTIVLMGNHERKHLRQTLSYSQEIVKLQFGDRYPEFLEWVAALPYYYETDRAILVHAAIEDGISISAQREEVLCGCTAGEKYLEKLYGKIYWSEIYTGVKPIIFGHHVVGEYPLVIPDKVYGIDTGACHGGRLTGIILPTFEIVQIPAASDYWHEELVKWQLPVMMAKPWESYNWTKIGKICDEFRNSANLELADFIFAKERWINDLLALAPLAISKVAAKLAESIAIYGKDEFKPHVRDLSYAALLYKANSGILNAEFLQQTFPTPDKWMQLMRDLGVATPGDRSSNLLP